MQSTDNKLIMVAYTKIHIVQYIQYLGINQLKHIVSKLLQILG